MGEGMTLVIKFITSCLWCEKEIPWDKAKKGKMICSVKCLKRINEQLHDKDYHYDRKDVV